MMRSVPLVLGCLLAFAAVALAESDVHQDASCVYTYYKKEFHRNCSLPDGTYKEANLNWEQWNTQVV